NMVLYLAWKYGHFSAPVKVRPIFWHLKTMKSIHKLAAEYEKMAYDDIFDDVNWHKEGANLARLAGKLAYKSKRVGDEETGEKLLRAHKLLLIVSDILKGM